MSFPTISLLWGRLWASPVSSDRGEWWGALCDAWWAVAGGGRLPVMSLLKHRVCLPAVWTGLELRTAVPADAPRVIVTLLGSEEKRHGGCAGFLSLQYRWAPSNFTDVGMCADNTATQTARDDGTATTLKVCA